MGYNFHAQTLWFFRLGGRPIWVIPFWRLYLTMYWRKCIQCTSLLLLYESNLWKNSQSDEKEISPFDAPYRSSRPRNPPKSFVNFLLSENSEIMIHNLRSLLPTNKLWWVKTPKYGLRPWGQKWHPCVKIKYGSWLICLMGLHLLLQMGFQSESRQWWKQSSLQSKTTCKRVQARSWYWLWWNLFSNSNA